MWKYERFYRFEHNLLGLALKDFLNEHAVTEYTVIENNHNFIGIIYKK